MIIQPRSISEFQSSLARAAGQGFDIIIGSSFDMIKPMQAVAAAFPNQKFGLVDVGPDPVAPNVVSSVTKDWEGSFLVGVIAAQSDARRARSASSAARTSRSSTASSSATITERRWPKPEVKVLESYSGTFTDPAAGKEYTLALVNQGSDINFAVAGATSAGVIDAAKSSNTFAIGVDSDQNYMAPGHVLTSMVKRVDTQAFDMIKSVVGWNVQRRHGPLLRPEGGRRGRGHGRVQQGPHSGRRVEAGRRAPAEGDFRRDRRAELLRPQAWPEGDGHAADGDAAVDRQREVARDAAGRLRAAAAALEAKCRGWTPASM